MPWIAGKDLSIAQPANTEGRFFADSYQRRSNQPLEYVSGDARIAPLVALAAPSRPHVYFDWAPQRSPWASVTLMRERGGLLVWPTPETTTAPPATLRAHFPIWWPKCRARLRARCRASCRSSASAGRWCGGRPGAEADVIPGRRFSAGPGIEMQILNSFQDFGFCPLRERPGMTVN